MVTQSRKQSEDLNQGVKRGNSIDKRSQIISQTLWKKATQLLSALKKDRQSHSSNTILGTGFKQC